MKLKQSQYIASLRLNHERTLLSHISGNTRIICDNFSLKLLEEFKEPKNLNEISKIYANSENIDEIVKNFKYYFTNASVLLSADFEETPLLRKGYSNVFPGAEKQLKQSDYLSEKYFEGQNFHLEKGKDISKDSKLTLSSSLAALELFGDEVLVTHPLMQKLFISTNLWKLALSFSQEAAVSTIIKTFEAHYSAEKILAACLFLFRKKILVKADVGEKESISDFLNFNPIVDSLPIQQITNPILQFDERVPPYRISDMQKVRKTGAIATIGRCQINLLVQPLQYIAQRAGVMLDAYSIEDAYPKLKFHSWMAVIVSPVLNAYQLYESFILKDFDKCTRLIPKIVSEIDYNICQIRNYTDAPIIVMSLGLPGLFSATPSSNSLFLIKSLLAELNLRLLGTLKKYTNARILDEERVFSHYPGNILDDEYNVITHHAAYNIWNFSYFDWFTGLPPPPAIECQPSLHFAEGLFKAILRFHVRNPVQMVVFEPNGLLWPEDFHGEGPCATKIRFYRGIHDALASLTRRGILLACLSSCPLKYLKKQMEFSNEQLVAPPRYWITLQDLHTIKSGKNKAQLLKEIINETGISEKNILFLDLTGNGGLNPNFSGHLFMGNKWKLRRYLLTSLETTALPHAIASNIKPLAKAPLNEEANGSPTTALSETEIEKNYCKILCKILKCSDADLKRIEDLRLLGLDSLGCLELLLKIEETLGIKIRDYDLNSATVFFKSRLFKAIMHSRFDSKESKKRSTAQEMSFDAWCNQTVAGLLRKHFESPQIPWILKFVVSTKPFDYQYVTWQQLEERAMAFLATYLENRLVPGDIVTILKPQGIDLVAAEVGAILGGFIPSICAFPNEKLSETAFSVWFSKIIENSDSRFIVCDPEFFDLIDKLLKKAQLDVPVVTHIGPLSKSNWPPFPKLKINSPVILQHSSGTTGLKKAVILDNRAVLAQAWHLAHSLNLTQKDVVISWLPLYHDMGLIGCLIVPLLYSIPTVVLSPFDWVREPSLLFTQVTEEKGTLCWLPNFAFSHMAKRISASKLSGIDLSSLRAIINCSEPITKEAMVSFYQKFSEIGLKYSSSASSYAMAETTLAVSLSEIGRFPAVITVQRSQLQQHGKIRILKETNLALDKDAIDLVSSGQILPGSQVRIVDKNGIPVANAVGEIWVKSDSAMRGYFLDPDSTQAARSKGWFKTGDLGFIHENELYVTGRKKDIIIIAGQNVFPHEVEELVSNIEGIRPGRVVAFGLFDETEGTEKLIILAETKGPPKNKRPSQMARLKEEIRAQVLSTFFVNVSDIVLYDQAVLLKSTSGKISRARNREQYLRQVTLRD